MGLIEAQAVRHGFHLSGPAAPPQARRPFRQHHSSLSVTGRPDREQEEMEERKEIGAFRREEMKRQREELKRKQRGVERWTRRMKERE